MILIETKTMTVMANEADVTSIIFERAERRVYVNYRNITPRRLEDVTRIKVPVGNDDEFEWDE